MWVLVCEGGRKNERNQRGVASSDGRSVWQVACSGAFIAIGHKPNTDFLGGQVNSEV